MSQSPAQPTPTATDDSTGVDTTPRELLALLDDEYTIAILGAIRREPKSARSICEECRISRPTVYRRLNSLVEAGLVDARQSLHANGHHRKVFEATLDAVSLEVTGDGLSATVSTTHGHGQRQSVEGVHSD